MRCPASAYATRGGDERKRVLYEPRVRLDTRAFALDKIERGVVGHVVCIDEVCNDDRGRARDTLAEAGE